MATDTVVRYAPHDIAPTRSMIDQLLEGSFFAPTLMDRWTRHAPSIPANLIETDNSYVVQIALPGLKSEKLEIQSLDKELRIRGQYDAPVIEGGKVIWSGLPHGEFTQNFTLPAGVANDHAEATYTNGILAISLPKADHAKVRTIPVKTTV